MPHEDAASRPDSVFPVVKHAEGERGKSRVRAQGIAPGLTEATIVSIESREIPSWSMSISLRSGLSSATDGSRKLSIPEKKVVLSCS